MASLPLEIWFTIVDHLPRKDQLRISRVSPQLCAVARKVIYRQVTLPSYKPAVMATLALLARDYSVARIVQELKIHTALTAAKEPTWFNTDALTGMANLRRLNLVRMPFCTKEDQLKFNNIVSESLPALRQLDYLAPHSEPRPDPETHVPALQISGLQEITWSDSYTFIHPSPILTTIHASRETLTHIRIPESTSNATTYELTQFFSLRFPCLSTLHLGGWNTATPVGTALTNFLTAHPLIEELELYFWNSEPDSKVHCHVSSDVAFDPGALPNLRRLMVDAFNLGILLRSGVLSLQTLEILHTGVHYLDGQNVGFAEFGEMYRALEAYGGLPGLKVLQLELQFEPEPEGVDGLENARWISGFGKLCPNVERFWGDFEVGWTAITNPDIFTSYTSLKSQMIPDMDFDDDLVDPMYRMKFAKKIAACNSSVTNLKFYWLDNDDVINFEIRFERDAEGRITAMVEVLHDGPRLY